MIGPGEDQASSLRRLLGGSTLRSAVFLGGDAGVGQTALVAATATAMARLGHAVVVVDAQPHLRSGAGWFDLFPRGDLADVLYGERRLDDVLLHAAGGVSWLPAARLGPAAGRSAADVPVARALSELAARFDCVLLDVPADRADRWWPAAAGAGSVLLGSSTAQRSITAAYAALKLLALQVGQQRYLWWMARTAEPDAAEAAWQKVAQTARRFLQVRIDYGGAVPVDPMVPRAQRLRRPLAEAFPGSRAAAAGAALAGLLDRPVALGTDPSAAWRALLVGEPAFGADPAQNKRPQAPDPSPSSVSARTELVSR